VSRPAVGILLGGTSAEREVSLASGTAVAAALERAGWRVRCYDYGIPEENARGPIATRLLEALRSGPLADVAVIFNALHGGAGEDGRIQALLELADVPYTGSGPLASALTMDKWLTKQIVEAAGVTVPAGRLWRSGDPTPPEVLAAEWTGRLGLPLVVKPVNQGSTVGFALVREAGELGQALATAADFGPTVLVESFIPGREVTVAVLDGEALPVVEIVPSHGVYDYTCKYTSGMSQYHCPADLAAETARALQEAALEVFSRLQHRDYSRMDFRLSEEERPYLLEGNTLPGLTATSLVPKAAAAAGIDFETLCARLVEAALDRGVPQ
jgi:D-alanine-D-alanine ligase